MTAEGTASGRSSSQSEDENAPGTVFYTPIFTHTGTSSSASSQAASSAPAQDAAFPFEATTSGGQAQHASSIKPSSRTRIPSGNNSRVNKLNESGLPRLASSRTTSRESGRSTSASIASSTTSRTTSLRSQSTVAAPSKPSTLSEKPGFMKSTLASASRRSSIEYRKDALTVSNTASTPRYASRKTLGSLQTASATSSPAAAASRSNSPLLAVTSKPTPASVKGSHSRHSSVASSRRSAPAPIVTNFGQAAASQEPRALSSAHHSPAALSHAIVRSTRSSGLEGVDIAAYAAYNESTASALRKLDGISSASSPRMSRAVSTSSTRSWQGAHPACSDATPRKNGPKGAVPPQDNEAVVTSSSTGPPSSVTSADTRQAKPREYSTGRESHDQTAETPVPSTSHLSAGAGNSEGELRSSVRKQSLSQSISSSVLAAIATQNLQSISNLTSPQSADTYQSQGDDTVFVQPSAPVSGSTRRSSGQRPPSDAAEMPLTPSMSSQRSSSASLAFGTSANSYAGSRDSTSATSVSVYSSPAAKGPSRSRRGSVSSDVSSVHSTVQDSASTRHDKPTSDATDPADRSTREAIPPVPPLPKDYENFAIPAHTDATTLPALGRDGQGNEANTHLRSPLVAHRSVSLEKPAGPRSIRNVSGSSMKPSENASLPASPASESTSFSSIVDRVNLNSKTPTKTKWSLSHALGITKSPPLPSSSSASSFASLHTNVSPEVSISLDPVSPVTSRHQHANSSEDRASVASNLPTRKLLSANNMTLQTSKSSSHLPRGASVPTSATRIRESRQRTDSLSGSSTTTAIGTKAASSVVTTSPGRSRSSLLSPRKTPSSIPFFARKPSIASVSQMSRIDSMTHTVPTSGMVSSYSAPALIEEKAGRRSILGINLFKREVKKGSVPPSPRQPSFQSFTTSEAMSPKHDAAVTEFGVRPSQDSKRSSVSARASSFIGRKRGKVCRLSIKIYSGPSKRY